MQKLILFFTVIIFFFTPSSIFAQESSPKPPKEHYFKAQVVKITDEGAVIQNGQKNLYQDVQLKILEQKDKGRIVNLHYGDETTLKEDRKVAVGEKVILLQIMDGAGATKYHIYDKYRLNNVLLVVLAFFMLVVAMAQLKGVGSLIGLVASLAVIIFFVIPNILNGSDPLLISILGSFVILFVSTYVAHGVSIRTTIALASTSVALLITALLATFATSFTQLAGVGNEDVASLQMGATSIINLKGLFLGGIIIGSLGALNDVTTSQAATIFELAKADKHIKFLDLVKSGFNVGREHILSLVNTLVLAYAGSSLFIFIFLVLNPNNIPYWVILNTETISEEIISATVGSTGLILAVPIVTLLSSYVAIEVVRKKLALFTSGSKSPKP